MIYANIYADIPALRLVNGASVRDKQTAVVSVTDVNKDTAASLWCFNVGLVIPDDGILAIAPTHGSSFGTWLRSDSFAKLALTVNVISPNNTVLYTIPAPLNFAVLKTGLRIDTPFTGLATASIGINSNVSLAPGGLGTIVGGLAAPMGAFRGVQGTELATPRRSILRGGDVIQHNVISPGYTGGIGRWIIVGTVF